MTLEKRSGSPSIVMGVPSSSSSSLLCAPSGSQEQPQQTQNGVSTPLDGVDLEASNHHHKNEQLHTTAVVLHSSTCDDKTGEQNRNEAIVVQGEEILNDLNNTNNSDQNQPFIDLERNAAIQQELLRDNINNKVDDVKANDEGRSQTTTFAVEDIENCQNQLNRLAEVHRDRELSNDLDGDKNEFENADAKDKESITMEVPVLIVNCVPENLVDEADTGSCIEAQDDNNSRQEKRHSLNLEAFQRFKESIAFLEKQRLQNELSLAQAQKNTPTAHATSVAQPVIPARPVLVQEMERAVAEAEQQTVVPSSPIREIAESPKFSQDNDMMMMKESSGSCSDWDFNTYVPLICLAIVILIAVVSDFL